ncbi:MAG TPA: hypothetical protein VFZ53_12750 [Polyangiaceae bacterium]
MSERLRAPKGKGPGLSKTRSLGLLERRTLTVLRSSDYRWRELFERADVMSEGACRDEPDGTTYYGSTSVLLPFASKGGAVPDELGSEVAALIANDPHARVRAVRMACLEAQVRSRGPLGRVRAELFVRSTTRGIKVDVEVEAAVLPEAAPKSRRAEASESRRGPRAQ